MSTLGIHPEAERELEDIVRHLQEAEPGAELGLAFLARYLEQVRRAIDFPATGTPAAGYAPELDVRSFRLTQFPYALVVGTVGERRVVLAIAHASREPGYWSHRVAEADEG